MLAVPSPETRRSRRGALLALRLGGIGVVLASVAGLVVVNLAPSPAAAADDSAITVRWTDPSVRGVAQPTRESASPHYAEFDELQVTVSQTQDLTDQAIRVTVTGMAATQEAVDGAGQTWTTAMNFMQAMQCWGNPADDWFRETCQWGGRHAQNNGLGNTVFRDNVFRVGSVFLDPNARDAEHDVLFRRYSPDNPQGGTVYTGGEIVGASGNREYPLAAVMSPATTNELQGARLGTGTSRFDFEVQSAATAPHLGCGREGHLTCYLVLVPRGTVFGGEGTACSQVQRPLTQGGGAYGYHAAGAIQGGGPLNPACDYWDNRIVVPIGFTPSGQSCAAGAAERGVIGSQLLVAAMSSWQRHLCQSQNRLYSFSTTADEVGRIQVATGGSGIAFGSFPLVPAYLNDELAEAALPNAALSYAPVAIGATVLAFFAEDSIGRIEQLRLSPRLVAKLLTQSYPFLVPVSAEDPQKNIAHLPAANRGVINLSMDPEFRALNPDNYQRFTTAPAVVMPGPGGADAIRQLWRWILADEEARAFLDGEEAPGGLKLNPYYLPLGHPDAQVPVFDENGGYELDGSGNRVMRPVGLTNVDGSPMRLSEATLDRFLKADESRAPITTTLPNQLEGFGTVQGFPYADDFVAAARNAFRADPRAKTFWDPNRFNPATNLSGDWVEGGAQIPGQRFVIAITDLASAERYALSTAQLRHANAPSFGNAEETDDQGLLSGLRKALSQLVPTETAAVKQVDPAAVTSGYPLTTVVYAAVNLGMSDAAARADYAALIREITVRGQQPGTGAGDLPPGYLPLTQALTSQAQAAAAAIEAWTAPTPPPDPPENYVSPPLPTGDSSYIPPAIPDPVDGEPEITDLAEQEVQRTPVANVEPLGQIGLGGSLVAGLAGILLAPVLFRGRRVQ